MTSTLPTTGEAQRSAPPRVVPVRHYGTKVVAVIAVAGLAAIAYAVAQSKIELSVIPEYLFSDPVLEGVKGTIIVSLSSMGVGLVLGLVLALMRVSRSRVLRTLALGYISIFRGTPVLLQLLLWFNLALVLPSISLPLLGSWKTNDLITPFVAALLGLGLNEGAYMAEIYRGGLLSVGKGQREAAAALGMTTAQSMRRVVLPQALRVVVPPTGNQFINMFKLSSLAYVINYHELLLSAVNVYTRNLLVIELLLTVCIWYLVLTAALTTVQFFIERRLARGARGGAPSARRAARTLLWARTEVPDA